MDSFYSQAELAAIGFRQIGRSVKISRKASLFNPGQMTFGNHVRVDDFCILSGQGGIRLGSYVHIAAYCALYAAAGIEMGDFSSLSSRVAIYTNYDDYSGAALTNPTVPENLRRPGEQGRVKIGRHAIVGTASTIFPNVELGDGAVLGAHSLLTRNIPSWTVFFGTPARAINKRKRDLLEVEAQQKEALGL